MTVVSGLVSKSDESTYMRDMSNVVGVEIITFSFTFGKLKRRSTVWGDVTDCKPLLELLGNQLKKWQ